MQHAYIVITFAINTGLNLWFQILFMVFLSAVSINPRSDIVLSQIELMYVELRWLTLSVGSTNCEKLLHLLSTLT